MHGRPATRALRARPCQCSLQFCPPFMLICTPFFVMLLFIPFWLSIHVHAASPILVLHSCSFALHSYRTFPLMLVHACPTFVFMFSPRLPSAHASVLFLFQARVHSVSAFILSLCQQLLLFCVLPILHYSLYLFMLIYLLSYFRFFFVRFYRFL